MRIVWKKLQKSLSVGGSAPKPRWPPLRAPLPDPRVITPTYYYRYVEFISSAKCILLPLKKGQNYTVNILLLLFPLFFPKKHESSIKCLLN